MYHSPISQVRSINPKYVTCKIAKVWHSITIFIACLVIPLLYIHVHVHSILSIEYLKVFILIANVINRKYVFHIPLYHIEWHVYPVPLHTVPDLMRGIL